MLHTIIFQIAKNISDVDPKNIDLLENRAEKQLHLYKVDDKGFKGWYARQNEGWILQLLLIFASPFITAKLMSYKNQVLNPDKLDFDDDDDEFDDEAEMDYKEALEVLAKRRNV